MTDDPKNSRALCARAYEGVFSAIVPCRDEGEAFYDIRVGSQCPQNSRRERERMSVV